MGFGKASLSASSILMYSQLAPAPSTRKKCDIEAEKTRKGKSFSARRVVFHPSTVKQHFSRKHSVFVPLTGCVVLI